ncbi:MAG TPA: tripartite tricarboxylate transporter substrate-binding protein [Ramlibacter sp.]|uniref:Bug family tripartite tricarboxylate transporter substrate binding protein n=1 Tax=Ramlibacter sp. TaxID=1917967 RepID=UPI002B79C4B0|nr:tripartite tricarboxylate transporter substrate-binding protein [Ramlibacter sp.]HVZ46512.1 tripartite tricarboxylate transporter substrate-binding protein [Ramlibacter sp.]
MASRRGVLSAALLAVAPFGAPAQPTAQPTTSYPGKLVRIVVGYSPGGANDLLMRIVAEKLQLAWGQPVIVDNKPGASSVISLDAVRQAPPDGHTITLNGIGPMVILPAARVKLPYDAAKDFVPFGPLLEVPFVLVVNPAVPASNAQEFVAWARANEGKINYAWSAPSSVVATELLLQRMGVKATAIPYKGGAELSAALIGGVVQFAIFDSASIAPHLKAGRVRGIAVTSSRRAASLPELPTMEEAGLSGLHMSLWLSMFAPAGVPPEILAKLNTEIARVFALPDVKEKMIPLGVEVVPSSPAATQARMRRESETYAAVVRTAGLKFD